MNLYYIDIKYATFGILEENNIVKKSAPIGSWMIGKNIEFIKSWVKKKNGEIIKIGE